MPVSYTHLDVYKRQASLAAELLARGLEPEIVVNNAGFGLSGAAAVLDRNEQLGMVDLNVRAMTELSLTFVAVSYTHLDVYKRQPLEHDPEKWVPVFRKDHAQTGLGTAQSARFGATLAGRGVGPGRVHEYPSGTDPDRRGGGPRLPCRLLDIPKTRRRGGDPRQRHR